MTTAKPTSASLRLKDKFVPNGERRLATPPEISDGPALVFELRHRSGIWEVTRDGRFYGDFSSESEALDSAQAAVRSVVAGGGRAMLSDAVIEL